MQSDHNKKKIIPMADIVVNNKKDADEAFVQPSQSNFSHQESNKEKKPDQTKSFFDELEAIGKPEQSIKKEKKKKSQSAPLSARQIGKRVVVMGIIAVIIGGGVWGAATMMPSVTVAITMNKTPWNFSDAIVVNKNASRIDVDTMTVPGEVFIQEKTAVLSFPASGEGHREIKAKGIIYIVNAYDSSPQPLVVNTRFETPQGLIFRTTEPVTVPGATTTNGVLQPSRIAVSVVADQAGAQYNIGPVEKFTIPGFSGSDKFNGFYGVSETAMEGGLVGISMYPTEEDKEMARTKAEETVRAQLGTFLGTQIPEGFTIIEGSQHTQIENVNVNEETKEDGTFVVTVEGTARGIIFKESDVLEVLRLRAIIDNNLDQDLVTKESTLSYQQPNINWETGIMQVPITHSAVLWKPMDGDSIRNNSLGKTEVDLKTYILGMAGVDSLSVSLWPFWVQTVPEKESRVTIVIQ